MNDEPTTQQQPPGPPPPPEPPTTPMAEEPGDRGKLTRNRADGMLAGVAVGPWQALRRRPGDLPDRLRRLPLLRRLRRLAYLALALFLPDESGEPLVKSSRWGLVAAIGLIGLFLVPAIGWGWGWGDGGGPWVGLWLIVPAAIAAGRLRDPQGPRRARLGRRSDRRACSSPARRSPGSSSWP